MYFQWIIFFIFFAFISTLFFLYLICFKHIFFIHDRNLKDFLLSCVFETELIEMERFFFCGDKILARVHLSWTLNRCLFASSCPNRNFMSTCTHLRFSKKLFLNFVTNYELCFLWIIFFLLPSRDFKNEFRKFFLSNYVIHLIPD